MDAKMRIGHFTATQPFRLHVKMARLIIVVATGLVVLSGTVTFASGLPDHDTNLERWAKETLAKRIGDIRDSYDPSETTRMITETDVKRGPLLLSADRNNDPIWLMATLRIGNEIIIAQSAFKARVAEIQTPYPPRVAYTGALVLAEN